MNRYREGQKVRIDYAKGGAIEGEVQIRSGVYYLITDGSIYSALGNAEATSERIITILSEPRPDEPQGLGAVVEAGSPLDGKRYHYVKSPRRSGAWWRAGGANDDGFNSPWDSLIDPVVLSEGWKP